jgi:hypothetical protein
MCCSADIGESNTGELFREVTRSARARGARELDGRNCPAPIAPTPDDAALMILRRYRA